MAWRSARIDVFSVYVFLFFSVSSLFAFLADLRSAIRDAYRLNASLLPPLFAARFSRKQWRECPVCVDGWPVLTPNTVCAVCSAPLTCKASRPLAITWLLFRLEEERCLLSPGFTGRQECHSLSLSALTHWLPTHLSQWSPEREGVFDDGTPH
jgi:hypothetical protein